MKIIIPKFNFSNNTGELKFEKNNLYIVPDFLCDIISRDAITKAGILPFHSIISIDNILKQYNFIYDKEEKKNIIIVRTGGYGDIIAISSLVRFLFDNDLVENMIFITGKKEIFKYIPYNERIHVISFSDSLNKFKFLFKGGDIFQEKTRYVIFEGIIEKSKANWYDLIFLQAGLENIPNEYTRPKLLIDESKFSLKLPEKYILLTLSSTSYVRRYPYFDITMKLLNKGYNVVIIGNHLTDYDKEKFKNMYYYHTKNVLNNLHILWFPLTFDEYIEVISRATITISVDTMVTHFREGIGKPSINIYSSFPSSARTITYRYATNIDLPIVCPYQPCFRHTKKPNEKCEFYDEIENKIKEVEFFPPCVIFNKGMVENKIIEIVEKYSS